MNIKYYLRGLGVGMIVTALAMSVLGGKTKAREMNDDEVIARAKQLGMIEDTTLANMALRNSGGKSDREDTDASEKNAVDKGEAIDSSIDSADSEAESQQKTQSSEEADGKGDTQGEKTDQDAEKEEREEADKRETGNSTEKDTATKEDKAAEDTEKKDAAGEEKKTESTGNIGGAQQEKSDAPGIEVKNPKRYTLVIGSGTSSVTVSRQLANMGLVSSAAEYDRYLCDNGYDKNIHAGTYELNEGMTEEEIAGIITRR